MTGSGLADAPRPLVPDEALAARLRGSPCALFLDVDGTLAPIAPRPEDARVPERTRAAIERLAGRAGVHVAVVSGRAAADARRLVDVDGIWVIGNHGCEIVAPDGTATVDERVAPFGTGMRAAARALEAAAMEVPGAFLEDKRWTLSLHYRLAAPNSIAVLREAAEGVAATHGFGITEGKAVIELRPPVHVHKGTAVLALAERLGALGPEGSATFIGDDATDEDAFRALRGAMPHAVTIRVGATLAGGSAAELAVGTTEDVRAFLEWLLDVRPA